MKDVARKANLHPSTVSLCLSNSPLVAEKTRQRVVKIAQEIGYRPHPYLTALMRNRRKGRLPGVAPNLAFLTLFPTRDGWHRRFPRLKATFQHAREQAGSRGFRLEELWAPLEKYSPRRIGDILYARNITGVLLSSFPQPMEHFDWQWERFAVVAIGPSLREPGMHRVRSNHFKSATIALKECHRLGYRRVGLALKQDASARMDHRWLGGFLVTQRELALADPPPPLLASSWSRDVFIKWFKENRLDAILVTELAEPSSWLTQAGVNIPGDVALISLSCPQIGGTVSGVYENWELQGSRAVNLLIDLLTDNELGLHRFPNISLVDGVWNPGEGLPDRRPPHARRALEDRF